MHFNNLGTLDTRRRQEYSGWPNLAVYRLPLYILAFNKIVGFVAAAVSMPMGGCRARRPVDDVSLVSAETVGVIV